MKPTFHVCDPRKVGMLYDLIMIQNYIFYISLHKTTQTQIDE